MMGKFINTIEPKPIKTKNRDVSEKFREGVNAVLDLHLKHNPSPYPYSTEREIYEEDNINEIKHKLSSALSPLFATTSATIYAYEKEFCIWDYRRMIDIYNAENLYDADRFHRFFGEISSTYKRKSGTNSQYAVQTFASGREDHLFRTGLIDFSQIDYIKIYNDYSGKYTDHYIDGYGPGLTNVHQMGSNISIYRDGYIQDTSVIDTNNTENNSRGRFLHIIDVRHINCIGRFGFASNIRFGIMFVVFKGGYRWGQLNY